MENLEPGAFLAFLFLVVGITIVLYALFSKSKSTSLKLTGEKVDGVILQQESDGNTGSSGTNMNDIVTVRFVTKKKEWITAEIKQEFAIFFTDNIR